MDRPIARRGGFAWPIILITAGVVFLLNNMGVITWDAWQVLWRLWPVLLIAAGLDLLLGRRSALASLIVTVLVLGLVGGAVWFTVTRLPAVVGQPLTTDHIDQPISGVTSADVHISFGAGALRLGGLQDSPSLIAGTAARTSGETLVQDFQVDNGKARYELSTHGVPAVPASMRGEGRIWSLNLSPLVPMALRVDTGVGQSILDLADLRLTDLRVESGVGKTEVRLPGRGSYRARISGGIGQVTIEAPATMPARIHVSAGIGGVSMAPRFLSQGHNTYATQNYASAEDKIDIDISGGIGQVVVK